MIKKGIILQNKLLIVILLFLSLVSIFNIFQGFSNRVVIFLNLIYIIIYIVAIFSLVKNNKLMAWIIAIIPSLLELFNPLRINEATYRYGLVLSFFEALAAGDPMGASEKIGFLLIHLSLILFIVVTLILFRAKESKTYKKNRLVALLIAIFLSLFVWLYLKKYKKFFVWLIIIITVSIVEILCFNYNYDLAVIIFAIGKVLTLIMWVSAISDAWRLDNKK